MNAENLETISDLRTSTEKEPNGVTTVSLNGVVDAYSVGKFRQIFNNLVDQKDYRLIVDLSGLEYMNTHGTGVLVGMHQIARQNNGDMVLINPNHTVKDSFALLGFPDLFKIAPDKKRSLESFSRLS